MIPPRMTSGDLIMAADVFVSLGALERITAWVAGPLRPGGMFAFTIEAHDGPEAYVLRDSRRYAHSAQVLAGMLTEAGFETVIRRDVLRMDRGAPIEGLVVCAQLVRGRLDLQGDGEGAAFA